MHLSPSGPKYFYHSVLAGLCSLALVGCSEPQQQNQSMPAPAVSVYEVAMQEVGNYREFVARTEAFQEADIRARVEGELIERTFREGAYVEKGQTLFKIDASEYTASVSEIEASLKSNRAAASRAERDLKRGREIAKDGFISEADLDKLQTNLDQAQAAVKSSEAALEKAKLNLSYTTIDAPFSGRIGKVSFDVGNIVNPQSGALAQLTDIDPIYVSFQVEESDYISYQQSHQQTNNSPEDVPLDLSLRLPNDTDFEQPGTLDFADTKIDRSTGTVELRAKFDNPNGIVMPGLFVTLVVESQDKQSQALVPQAAVQENQQGKFVLVVKGDNTVAQRLVDLGRRIDAMWVVKSGIEQGERVIVEGLQKVRSGVEVNPVVKQVDAKTGTISDQQ
ncbi:efflux RND transporter periplasmic adaptor subunit [Pseudoalteromonas sp. CnMc7-15]|uniref:efflux RND transporter periplasmic adaptor subunit n=1 Tax=unclassified Pseudoalteromonas TaxID=194690 RepID=UPI001EF51BAB|nr:efflux RND transporter periplasmic adaptor subunit [Pseudoalteromonas sp. CnMc7-15]MCG7567738.1 efflux RND transporter periplasmic adaptor subunit [Pseudoalteromonas sp. CnMc7-15]